MADLISIDVEQRLAALEEEARALHAENRALRSKIVELENARFPKEDPVAAKR